jgi:hypothetical protein
MSTARTAILSALPGLTLGGFALSVLAGVGEIQPAADPTERCTLTFSGNITLADVPVARTPAQMAQGLMFRKDAGPGMLFSWQSDEQRVFWMRNTLIPLSAASSRPTGCYSGLRICRRIPMTITTRPSRRQTPLNSLKANLLKKA